MYYIRSSRTCQVLFHFVEIFFALDAGTTAAFQTACLPYQILPLLSTPFYVFSFFLFQLSNSIYANTTTPSKTVPNETPVSRWIPRSGRLPICLYVRSGRQQISPTALVAFRSISRWLRLPRNRREISFCSSTNRPSTKTSNSARISSVTSHRG